MSANIGGQAVLEGVMMRGPGHWALAVRKPDGEIAEVQRPIKSLMARHWVWRLPVIRGVIALGESLAIGFRALAISANYAAQEEDEHGEVVTELSRGAIIFSFAGQPVGYWLIASRILLLPVIAGLAYELIRFAAKRQHSRILMTLLAPGLWLQRLTTREPTLDQLEVSIRALKEVLQREGRLEPEERQVEVMA